MQMSLIIRLLLIMGLMIIGTNAWTHGYVGKRFFPSTISVNEPFISDKIALPVYRTESTANDGQAIWVTNPQLQYSKTIMQDFQVSATASYLHIQHPNEQTRNGFDDWEVGIRYNTFISVPTESIFSVGLNATLGGTGSHVVNADSTTIISPVVLFAQGMGILPDSLKFLKPLGVTATLGPNINTGSYDVSSISWGISVAYSLPYLNQFIAHSNSLIMDHVVPVIEFPFTKCTQGACSGQITGTIDPGVIIYNNYGQVAIEALIPSNSKTGSKVGGVIQLYLYLDTVAPNSLGKPLFVNN